MKHFGRHIWKLKSKEILKSPLTIALEQGRAITIDGYGMERDSIIYVFECTICGSEKAEKFQ